MTVALFFRHTASPEVEMTVPLFLVALTVGAGMLALWINFRFPKLAPERIMTAVIHVGVALLVGLAVVPALANLVSSATSPLMRAVIITFIIGLPALIYSLLAAVWVILIAQGAMRRYR